MTKSYSVLDLQKMPVVGLVPESMASPGPSSPVVGQLWWDTTNGQLKVCTNATGPVWAQCDNVGGGTLTIQDEGANVGGSVTQLDFQGAGITATAGAGEVIVTVSGAPTGSVGGTDIGGTYPNALTINASAVTYAKMQNVSATNRLLGRYTAGAGNVEEVTLAADHAFATGALQLGAFTGDITKTAGSLATAIASGAVSYAKIQNVAASRLLGNPTGSAATASEISLAADHAFSSGSLQLGAFTGDITKTAGTLATAIASGAVSYAKIQNVAASRLLGNPTGSAASAAEISLAADHEFSASTLRLGAFTGGEITKAAGSLAATIAAGAVTVAKLATAVNLNAIATANAATADITVAGFKITNLGNPTAASDAANKGYVDSVSAGLDPKESVDFASTANITGTYNATGGTAGRGQLTVMSNAAIDGVTPAAGDRVLLKNQSTGAQNGIWVISTLGTGANGIWDRAPDFDTDAEVTPGAFVFVEEGTNQADTGWVLTTNAPITIGGASGTTLAWTQFSGPGTVIPGNGLVQGAGNTIDAAGTANRITVAADSIDIASTYVGQASITTLGTIGTGVWNGTPVGLAYGGTGTDASTAGGKATARSNLSAAGVIAAIPSPALTANTWATVTHNLNNAAPSAQFLEAGSSEAVIIDWKPTGVNTAQIRAGVAVSASALSCIFQG